MGVNREGVLCTVYDEHGDMALSKHSVIILDITCTCILECSAFH